MSPPAGFTSTIFAAPAINIPGLPGIFAWWRSDLGISQTSGSVNSWTDQIGAKVLAVNGSFLETSPTYTSVNSNFNNFPSLDFGTIGTEGLQLLWTLAQPFSIFYCYRLTNTAISGVNYMLADTAANAWLIYLDSTPEWNYQSAIGSVSLNSFIDINNHAVCFIPGGTADHLYIDGSGTDLDNTASSATTSTQIIVGYDGTNAIINFSIAEIIVCTGTSSLITRQQVFAYFAKRYGFTAS
jgi:hypothetical protein